MTELMDSNPIDMLIRIIGIYGPIVLFVMAIVQLYSRPKYLFWFGVLISLNEVINRWLKNTLCEPRPIPIVNHVELLGKYGMPSGHTQHAVFIATYMLMVQPSWVVFCISLVIVVIVAYERYADKFHTFRQILVGGIFGCLIAYIGVNGIRKYMEYRSVSNKY